MTSTLTEVETQRHGERQRKRGAELEDAILHAAISEVAEHGCGGFSIEAVAARAQTGKASIYRRWSSRNALLLDAFCAVGVGQCSADFEIADDVTTEQAFRVVAQRIAQVLSQGGAAILRELVTEAARDPQLARAMDESFYRPRRERVLALLRRGVERGEVRPAAATDTIAEVMPALLAYRLVWLQRDVAEQDITEIVDQVVLPLIAP